MRPFSFSSVSPSPAFTTASQRRRHPQPALIVCINLPLTPPAKNERDLVPLQRYEVPLNQNHVRYQNGDSVCLHRFFRFAIFIPGKTLANAACANTLAPKPQVREYSTCFAGGNPRKTEKSVRRGIEPHGGQAAGRSSPANPRAAQTPRITRPTRQRRLN